LSWTNNTPNFGKFNFEISISYNDSAKGLIEKSYKFSVVFNYHMPYGIIEFTKVSNWNSASDGKFVMNITKRDDSQIWINYNTNITGNISMAFEFPADGWILNGTKETQYIKDNTFMGSNNIGNISMKPNSTWQWPNLSLAREDWGFHFGVSYHHINWTVYRNNVNYNFHSNFAIIMPQGEVTIYWVVNFIYDSSISLN
jgi:hypothetical protein